VSGLRPELTALLRGLDDRLEALPEASLNSTRELAMFCLVLASRRRAVKPVERMSARIRWAREAHRTLDALEDLHAGRVPLPEGPPPRRAVRRPL
jgi:hypothetical protein